MSGESLNSVITANELLTRVNLMQAFDKNKSDTPIIMGQKCIVVGAGNVAMDAARTARRLGADVTVVYRRRECDMPARAEEIEHAKQEGINFEFLTNPVEIIGDDDNWVTGIRCVRMQILEDEKPGKARPVQIENSEFEISCDTVVIAIGTKANAILNDSASNLQRNSNNLIVVDPLTLQTSIDGVFAGGDIVSGAATVIEAMGAGKLAAQSIQQYLLSK
ncbi:MAG: FAD-dependent oxidoreductase [Coriobacteriales bacterium]|nr:FAD-dependent oxidoreductase [Coriobacteriales bacterium]